MWQVALPRRNRHLHALMAAFRHWLAWLNGDHAYTCHLAHLREQHPERPPPSRAEFYRSEVERRWNGVRRCC